MSKRRSLNDALSPEEEAFLKQKPAAAKPKSQSEPKPESAERTGHKSMPQPTPSKENPVQEAAPLQSIPAYAAPVPTGSGTINTRIDPKITTALLRASVDRRIAGKTPSTQKDIVAEALVDWFLKHGYPI